MPRDIPVGNDQLLVNFDASYQMRDVYFPHIGKENHSAGHPFRFGVWCDDVFTWVHGGDWQRSMRYLDETLVSEVTLFNARMQLRLTCNDAVDFHENVYLKRVRVQNLSGREREVRLFFSHDFHLYETEAGDTAYYYPTDRALIHYKDQRYFWMNCATDARTGWDQFACGRKEMPGQEGTWRDCEDGQLSGNAIQQGSVDSAGAVHVTVPARGEVIVRYWMAAATNYQTLKTLHQIVLAKSPDEMIERTANFWRLWVNKDDGDVEPLPEPLVRLFKTSLLIIRSQVDEGGAIIAANDGDILQWGRDTYSYMWPRDGALVSHALTRCGHRRASGRFFFFCNQIITSEGYFLHNYNADGSTGSNWHSWVGEDPRWLPIQEDETALVVWSLWHLYNQFRDVELIKPLYRSLIIRAAEFMCDYRDPATRLPLPSFDLWEERRGIHGWTLAAVYGGLQGAANFAEKFGERKHAERYRAVAAEIKEATDRCLWQPSANRFARSLFPQKDGTLTADLTIDAANAGLWYFGMYAPDDPRIVATMESIRNRLWVKTKVGGIARYENDYYHQQRKDIDKVPGNPWFICTLWLAQWLIATARDVDDLRRGLELTEWVAARALPSGVLAEQVHPDTNQPLSVSPLTWSHATFALTVLEYLDKRAELEAADGVRPAGLQKKRSRAGA